MSTTFRSVIERTLYIPYFEVTQVTKLCVLAGGYILEYNRNHRRQWCLLDVDKEDDHGIIKPFRMGGRQDCQRLRSSLRCR